MYLSWAFALSLASASLVARFPLREPALARMARCRHVLLPSGGGARTRFSRLALRIVPALNQGFGKQLFGDACPPGVVSCPLDPKMTLIINTVAIWVGFGGCMVFATLYPDRFLLPAR